MFKRLPMRFVQQLFVACLVVVMLSACGWQLRGSSTVELSLKQLAINNQSHDGVLYQLLLLKLRQAGVEIVPESNEAAPVLVLHQVGQSRRTLTMVDGRAQEYELLYRLDYEVVQAGQVLQARQQLESARAYSYDASQVLAKEREQDRLYRETRNEVIDALLMRLRTIEVEVSEQ